MIFSQMNTLTLLRFVSFPEIRPGRYRSPRHGMPCTSTLDTIVHSLVDDMASLGPGCYASQVIGCHLTLQTRMKMRVDDVAGS